MSKIDIIVLDDDIDIHGYYRSVLEPIPGIRRVKCCEDEIELSQQLRMFKPHVVISDIHMEPKSGPQILLDHRKELGSANIVILSCADQIAEYSHLLLLEGMNVIGHLQKPLRINDLYDILGYGID